MAEIRLVRIARAPEDVWYKDLVGHILAVHNQTTETVNGKTRITMSVDIESCMSPAKEAAERAMAESPTNAICTGLILFEEDTEEYEYTNAIPADMKFDEIFAPEDIDDNETGEAEPTKRRGHYKYGHPQSGEARWRSTERQRSAEASRLAGKRHIAHRKCHQQGRKGTR